MEKAKTFTKIPNNLLEELLYSNLNASQRRVVDLVIRLTHGCHREWASIKQADFCACRVTSTHIKSILNSLLESDVIIRNDSNKNKYKVNEKIRYRFNETDNKRFSKLLSKNLKPKSYQVGNTTVNNSEDSILPIEEDITSQRWNKGQLPIREVLDSKNTGFSVLKETINKIKKSDKDNIDQNNTFLKINPSNENEQIALEGCIKLEPNNPRAYSTTYLYSLNKGLPKSIFYQYVSEINQSNAKNKGAVFNKKVSDYFKKKTT